VWKAHGTAGAPIPNSGSEQRFARLFQFDPEFGMGAPIAVLEQPSPRGVGWQVLGRRNIVLPETGELNASTGTRDSVTG
jgi:hypothetical protein